MARSNFGGTSDETYLEAFIEHISTLPHEVRRNMELIKDLDRSCAALMGEMTQLQRDYVHRVEEKMGRLDVVGGAGVRVVAGGDGGDDDDLGTHGSASEDDEGGTGRREEDRRRPVVLPTTEELVRYVREPQTLSQIGRLQADCLQQAEEKVAIASQTYSLVDNICRRLDADLREMEKALLAAGDFQTPVGTAKPNDRAAIQLVPGSPDWILAKVVTYDPHAGMYKLSDEDVESSKIFNLPESQVIILSGLRNLRVGDSVYALYPDTTTFYPGTVSQAPRKASGGGSFAMVSFKDDHDEHGITHDKAILLKYIMLPP